MTSSCMNSRFKILHYEEEIHKEEEGGFDISKVRFSF